MVQLQDKELLRLAEITGTNFLDVSKLYTMHLLDEKNATNLLIRDDYYRIKRTGKYRSRHIITRLMKQYDASEGKVLSAVYSKNKKHCYCDKCNKRISKSTYQRTGGVCDDCYADSIEL